MFRTGFLSIVRSLVLYTQQWFMSYRLCWLLANKKTCPKHVELYSKYKFEKLVHLVGFIIKILPKRRYGIANLRCVIFQKSADLLHRGGSLKVNKIFGVWLSLSCLILTSRYVIVGLLPLLIFWNLKTDSFSIRTLVRVVCYNCLLYSDLSSTYFGVFFCR